MKTILPLLTLLLTTTIAHAQKAKDFIQFENIDFSLAPGKEQALLYSNLEDTLKKPDLRLARTSAVEAVGQHSPRWAVVKKNGYSYFIRQSDLAGLGAGQTVKQAADIVGAPLPLDPSTSLINFVKVIQTPGANKDELYARGKVWFANTFKSAQNVIQADDKAAGILIGKGWQTAYVPNIFGTPIGIKLWFTAKLAFKDGRYKYELTDFKFEYPVTKYDLNPTPMAAERITSQAKKDGTLTGPAKAHAHALSQEARSTGMELELSMNRPATGSDF